MTQKTIKALYKQPINYKLTKDGYKTINGVIHAQDGMPKVVDLSVPSELYTTDLEYNVDIDVNGAPIITTSEFTLPDEQICEAKEYCYAPKGTGYNYIKKQEVIHKYLDTTSYTVVGSPTIDTTSGIITNFNSSNNINIGRLDFTNKLELYAKIYCTSHQSKFWFSSLVGGSGCPGIGTDGNGLMRFYNGNNYEVGYFNINTWYWVYFIQENSTSKLYYIQDNNYSLTNLPEIGNWLNGPFISSNLFSSSYGFKIGTNTNYSSEYWSGSVDLSGFLIKCDNNISWKPFINETTIEDVTVQIPGILDSSVTTDDWQQNQEYKLYQLKNQNDTDILQLTENSITDTTQKYKQYINQLTIPARYYKWYYKSYPTRIEPNFYNMNCSVINRVAMNFTEMSMFEPMLYSVPSVSFSFVLNIETGDMLQDCGLFKLNEEYSPDGVFVCHQNKFDGGKLLLGDSDYYEMLVQGVTTLAPNTKYWLSITYKNNKVYVYLLEDTGLYTKETLPVFESGWTQEGMIDFISEEYYYPMINIGNTEMYGAKVYDDSGTLITDEGTFYFEGGKVYLDDSYVVSGENPAYNLVFWEPYRYFDYVYMWAANKSLYSIMEHENFANYLDFSRSYINVSETTWDKYVNPIVYMMPKNGGEDDHTYVYRTQGELVDYTNLSSLPQTLLDGSNFEISGGVLRNGSKSYNVNNGYSYGYLKLTPTENITVTVNASCSSESNWDYGACYIGTAEYKATRDQIENQTTDGNGSWLFSISGTVAATNYTTTLNKDVTYYVQFYYAKDGTQQKGDDRVYIHSLTGFVGTSSDTYSSLGCIADGSIDDGTEQQWDVYYPSDFSQPILVNHGQTFTGGTKVDTITLPAHTTYIYEQGGTWTPANTNE